MIRKLLVLALATIALAAAAVPAMAFGPPYNVKVGTNTAGTYLVTLNREVATSIVFTVGGNKQVRCERLNAFGQVVAGSNRNPVMDVTGLNFVGCTFNGLSVSVQGVGASSFRGTGTLASSQLETIPGFLDNLQLQVRSGSSICSFDVQGRAAASLQEQSQQRLLVNENPPSAITGDLRVTSAAGCGGQIQSGNSVKLQTSLTLTSSSGLVNLY